MYTDLYIMLFLVALLLLILSVYEESIIFGMMSFICWMIVFVQSLYIEIPYVAWTDIGGTANITEGIFLYSEYGFSALSLAFIFFTIIWMLVLHFDWHKRLP